MVIPAILEPDRVELARKIAYTLSFSKHIHIDLIDNSFAPVTTMIEPEFFAPYIKHGIFELHMMVTDPTSLVTAYARAGFSRLIGHVEHMSDPINFIQKVRHNKAEAFLGIDLATSIDQALNFPVSHSGLDGVMIMTINAGKSGQPFEPIALDKIRHTHAKYRGLTIAVDGGINEHTLAQTKLSGASVFAVTSALYNTSHPAKKLEELNQLATF